MAAKRPYIPPGTSHPQLRKIWEALSQVSSQTGTGAVADVDGDDINLDTSNFNGVLSGSDDNIQAALETVDDVTAGDIPTSTTNFNGHLSGLDNTVQKALDILDDHSHSQIIDGDTSITCDDTGGSEEIVGKVNGVTVFTADSAGVVSDGDVEALVINAKTKFQLNGTDGLSTTIDIPDTGGTTHHLTFTGGILTAYSTS